MNETLFHNWMMDLKKKEMDPLERAKIIREHLSEKNISIRHLSRDLEIPKSTVEDWLLWDRLSVKEYKAMKKNKMTHSDIYKTLRNNRGRKMKEITEKTKIDYCLENTIKELKIAVCDDCIRVNTISTIGLIHEARDLINRIEMRVEQYRKKD